jgi:hypothetical protein
MAEQFKVHDPTGVDSFALLGILAGGGLAGQANEALSQMERGGSGAALTAVGKLFMGALANDAVNDKLRYFLFALWKTTEDEQAAADDLDIQDRLEPRYERDAQGQPVYNPHTGERRYDKNSLYYRKLKRFYKLNPRQMLGIALALYRHPDFKDFLASLREDLGTITTEPPTASNGSTDSPTPRLHASP